MVVKCPYCSKKAELVSGKEIYYLREDLYHRKFWLCRSCNAYVGTFKDGKPMGSLADAKLRLIRVRTHKCFDSLWQGNFYIMTRTQAYEWLAESLNINIKDCHIGLFDTEMCKKVIELSRICYNKALTKHYGRCNIETKSI